MVQGVSTLVANPNAPVTRSVPDEERAPAEPGVAPKEQESPQQSTSDKRVEQLEQTSEAVERRHSGPSHLRLGILLHEDTGRFVYRSINPTTREVENQYPPEDMLRQMTYLRELRGQLFDEKT